jgi:hypothetical protein
MLPSLYGPKIFRASPEKDFFDSIGHELPFSTPTRRVSNASINGHSGASVGNAALKGPPSGGRQPARMCQKASYWPYRNF